MEINTKIIDSPIDIMSLDKESMWKDKRYAPSKNPRTGPNAAILYMHPVVEEKC